MSDPVPTSSSSQAGGVVISKRVLLINSVSSMIQRLISLTVLVWLQQYLLKRISEDEYAIYRVVMALLVFLPLVTLIVGGALGRYITESYAQKDLQKVTQIVSTLFPFCFAAAGLILLVGGVMTVFIDHILVITPNMLTDARIMWSVLAFMAAVRVVCLPFNAGLHVRQKFLWMHLIGLGSEVVRLSILFALLFGVSTRVLWVVLAGVPANLLGLAVTIHLSRRLIPALTFKPSQFRRELVRPLLSFGGWLVVAKVASSMRDFTAPYLLNRLSTSAAVGSFALGTMVEKRLFSGALGPLTTTQPVLTALYATGQSERLRRYYFRFSRYVLWAFLFITVPLVVFRNEVFQLYLDDTFQVYAEAATVMALVLVRAIFVFPQPVLAQLALAKAAQRPLAVRVVLYESMTILLMLTFVWGFDMGAVGAALGLFLGGAIGMPTLHWSLGIQLTNSSWRVWMKETVWPGVVPALVALPVGLVLQATAPSDSWHLVGLWAALVCGTYAFVLLRFCMDPTERTDLWKLLGRLRPSGAGRVGAGS